MNTTTNLILEGSALWTQLQYEEDIHALQLLLGIGVASIFAAAAISLMLVSYRAYLRWTPPLAETPSPHDYISTDEWHAQRLAPWRAEHPTMNWRTLEDWSI